MQYEHAIDTAMREIRNLKHSVRDENWEGQQNFFLNKFYN